MTTQKKTYDLTQGGIINRLLLVALPIMGTQLMQMAYNLTDMFWLGRVSSDVVAASGTAGMYLWLSNGFLFIGRMGAEIGVSQNMGKGDQRSARKYSQNSLTLALVIGVLFGACLMVFNRPLVGFFNIQEAHVAADASLYLLTVGTGIPATFISAAIAGTFNGVGNSRTPFIINATGLIFNMALDPILILNAGMGIFGAAIATVIAQYIVCLLSLIAIVWNRTRPFEKYRFFEKPKTERIVQIFRWSIPIAVESMLFTFLSMIISRFVSGFGADAIAAQKVGGQIESLSWLICGGFSSAITAFVGQNYGASKWGRIRGCGRISLIALSIWGVVVSVILLTAGGPLFRIFLPEPHLAAIGVSYMRILAACQIFGAIEAAAAGVFRGIGRTLPPSAVSITCNAFRVPLSYALSITSLGLNGIWLGITLGAIIRGIWMFAWYFAMIRRQPNEDLIKPA